MLNFIYIFNKLIKKSLFQAAFRRLERKDSLPESFLTPKLVLFLWLALPYVMSFCIQRYFALHSARLKRRFNVDGKWFQYGRKQGLMSEVEKLIAPEISKGGNFSYDKNGDFYSTTTIYGYIKKSDVLEDYKCFMALLNSKLFWWFLVNTGTTLANGYFRFMPSYIKPFPIPSISKDIEQSLIKLVDKIMEIKQLKQEIDYSDFEKDIDKIVYTMYNLSEEDITAINKQID